MRPTDPLVEPRFPSLPQACFFCCCFFNFLRMGTVAQVLLMDEKDVEWKVEVDGMCSRKKTFEVTGNVVCGSREACGTWTTRSLGLGGSWASPQHLHSYRIKTLMAPSRTNWLHHRSGHVCFKGCFFIVCFVISWISVWTHSFQQLLSLNLEET